MLCRTVYGLIHCRTLSYHSWKTLLCLARQVPHHQVKQWLHHGRNEHMSAKAYRAHALAELASSATFNYRCDTDAVPVETLNGCPSVHVRIEGLSFALTLHTWHLPGGI